MESKVWFITGTSKGFGRVWAESALARGDRVAATARDVKTLAPLVERYGPPDLSGAIGCHGQDSSFPLSRPMLGGISLAPFCKSLVNALLTLDLEGGEVLA